jgi:hypothetical protein
MDLLRWRLQRGGKPCVSVPSADLAAPWQVTTLLEAEGRLENHGKKGAPRYRRADLPTKPRSDDGFDVAAEARRLIPS